MGDPFRVGQFKLPGYASTLVIARNQFAGGVMVFVREDISSKLVSIEELPTEWIYAERNFCKKKWHLRYSYNPDKYYFKTLVVLRCSLDLYSADYDHFFITGDFNAELRQGTCMF